MAGINVISVGDDDVYEATAVVEGGTVLIPTTGATNPGVQGVGPAGDAALNVVGVAARRAEPIANQGLTGTDADGYPFVNVNTVDELTTVYRNKKVPVVYTAAAVNFGDKICTAAAGKVRKWVSGTDSPAAIIGECRAIGGVSSAGGMFPAKIY